MTIPSTAADSPSPTLTHSFPIPRWLQDLDRLLPIRSQFVLAGNIRDSFLTLSPAGPTLAPLLRCLWHSLLAQGFRVLLVFDQVEGLRVYPNEPAVVELATRLYDLKLQDGVMPMSLESLLLLMRRVIRQREARSALVVDFASRLARHPDHLDAGEHNFFVAAERLAVSAMPVVPRESAPGELGGPRFNPVLWLLNRPQDLPSWFALDNPKVATITVHEPDHEARLAAARVLAPQFKGFDGADPVERDHFVRAYGDGSEGLTLGAMSDVAQVAARQGYGIDALEDAFRCFKTGVVETPWRKPWLRERMADAMPALEARVKGQPQAVTKAVDILIRSIMGLTGAQARSGGNRPRGVLFFAGPTGVGKTELAKALTELIFGDEKAYLRFDMSEFSAEHSSARLLGAPPGYVGFDAGGELTNAVRERPFSVLLFDEIEKAHPRILDKFLQILEDGRLTDGRGETVYFSETVLIFTSNLGVQGTDEAGRPIQLVQPGDDYSRVEQRIRTAIGDYFKVQLSRPEILNRIGDNVVVFNFITPPVAEQIFSGMVANVLRRVRETHGLILDITPGVLDTLRTWCLLDLSNGGRGIGNRVESAFINPLARALFHFPVGERLAAGGVVVVSGIEESAERIVTLSLA